MFGQFDTSGSASGYLTNPLQGDLNMGGFSVENVDNLITTPISEAIDVNNHSVENIKDLTFKESSTNKLTTNTEGQLLWAGHVVGSGVSSGVHNPMEEQLNAGNHTISNIKSLEFNTGDELRAEINGDETLLYFDNLSIANHSYNKATKNTFIKSVSDITEIIGPKNWFVQYTPIPDYGHFTYTFDLFLTFENVIEQGKYKLYLSDSTTGNITENDILIADMDNADWTMGDNGRWASINFILDNTGSQTNGVISNTGLNHSLTTGKPYLVLCVSNTNGIPGDVQNKMIGKAVSITRNYASGPTMIYSQNGTVGEFNVSAEKEPTFNNDILATYKKTELSEVAVSDHIIASFLTESDTSGLLEAKVINDKSAFICDLFFMNNSGTLTLSGSRVQTVGSDPQDNVKFAVDGERINIIVDSSSTDKKNWKCKWNKDYVYKYIDPGYGESLYFPFAEDLNDDITDLTFDSDRGGSWYSFVDNSLLFGSGNTGAYYTTEGAYMNTNTNFSMSFWMKIPSTFSLSSQALILSTTKEDENNNSGWRFMVYSNNLDWNIHLNSGAIVYKRINANALKDDQWHHYVYTYDGESPDSVADSLKAYWDGVDKGSAAVSGTFSKSSPISSFVTDKFAISGKHNSHLLNGLQMSNLRFWNRVITSDEIARLYSERA